MPQIYCGALGWFDGDPTALSPTPRAEYATRFVTGARVLEGSLDVDAIYPFAGIAMVSPEVLAGFPARNRVDGLPPRLKA